MAESSAPSIQPVVLGTAGHIDHGKSSLVQALTGTDPDRLREEKERGLTIDLGFAPLELPDGRLVGMVDVPGHERFIRNMVAGATGIDLVMLVVAADDGVMPQTREHLDIMELLGVRRGCVALNKIDAVDEEIVELAAEDVRTTVAGTFLEDAPLVRVSAVTGQGIEELRATLQGLASDCEPRSDEGVFRMPVQRVFSARGFGTVLTGIPLSGSVAIGDTLEVVPGGQSGRVRSLQAYHRATDRARAGHSTAINLSDIDHKRVSRGHVVCSPGFFRPVSMVAARLLALPSLARPLADRLPVRLHVGTAEAVGELVLLDQPSVEPGATALVQLRLAEPVVCAPGDRFVLRLASPALTLGGGTVLEESRHRLKRFKGFVLDELSRQEQSLGSPAELLESILVRLRARLVPLDEISKALKRSSAETRELLNGLEREGCVLAPASGERWIHRDRLEEARAKVRNVMDAWFADHPHRRVVATLELRQQAGLEPALLAAVLEAEQGAGRVELQAGGNVRPVGRELELDPRTLGLREDLVGRLQAAGFQPPGPAELPQLLGASAEEVGRVLELLVDEGRVVHVGKEIFIDAEHVSRAREAIAENCRAHGQLEIPELRDALGTTRKWLIPLLEYFDAQGLTLRQGGHRVLRQR